jgi:hypothetical protein
MLKKKINGRGGNNAQVDFKSRSYLLYSITPSAVVRCKLQKSSTHQIEGKKEQEKKPNKWKPSEE